MDDGAPISAHPTREGVESRVVVWLPGITPAGMAFYTRDRFPEWKGSLFVVSLYVGRIGGTGRLQRIVFKERIEERRCEALLADLRTCIREVRQESHGFLYVLTDQHGPLCSRFRLPLESASPNSGLRRGRRRRAMVKSFPSYGQTAHRNADL